MSAVGDGHCSHPAAPANLPTSAVKDSFCSRHADGRPCSSHCQQCQAAERNSSQVQGSSAAALEQPNRHGINAPQSKGKQSVSGSTHLGAIGNPEASGPSVSEAAEEPAVHTADLLGRWVTGGKEELLPEKWVPRSEEHPAELERQPLMLFGVKHPQVEEVSGTMGENRD